MLKYIDLLNEEKVFMISLYLNVFKYVVNMVSLWDEQLQAFYLFMGS